LHNSAEHCHILLYVGWYSITAYTSCASVTIVDTALFQKFVLLGRTASNARDAAFCDLCSCSVGVCLSCGHAVQTRLNGSRSCLEWRFLGANKHKTGVTLSHVYSMRPSPYYFGHLLQLSLYCFIVKLIVISLQRQYRVFAIMFSG